MVLFTCYKVVIFSWIDHSLKTHHSLYVHSASWGKVGVYDPSPEFRGSLTAVGLALQSEEIKEMDPPYDPLYVPIYRGICTQLHVSIAMLIRVRRIVKYDTI